MRVAFTKNLTIAATSLLLLNGCVTTAVVAGASALTASAFYDQRSFKTMAQDRTINRHIKKALAANAKMAKVNVDVYTLNHNTLLVGQVKQPEQRAWIYQLAKKTPKVKRVYNQIVVGELEGAITQAKDMWLAGHARAALLQKKGLRSAQVKPVVSNGVVYLMGIMPNRQQALATDAVRKVPGVKKVVTLFENVR